MATETCMTADQGIFTRATEILTYLEANLKLPACGDDYCTDLADIITELQSMVALLGGAPGSIVLSAANHTNTAGSVPVDWKSVQFINQGSTDVTILGATFSAGSFFNAGDFGVASTNAIAWSVPVGGDLLIIEAR